MASPRRKIGPGFGRLWAASTAGNLGDGIGRVAIALLAARLTRDPFAIAVITAMSYLPWLMFGLPAGVLVDRHDRRRLAMVAGTLRTAAIAVLVVAAATDQASLWLLYAVVLVLFSCETVYDNAVPSMVPMLVTNRDDLERANGRLQGARLVMDRFVGPPLAGMVFALAATAAFGANVACYAIATMLLLTLPGSYRARQARASSDARPASVWQDMAEGLRYVYRHRLDRTLLELMMLIGFGGAMVNATNVLWTLDVLGVSEAFYGLFTLTMAVGALAGSQTAAALADRTGRGRGLWLTVVATGVGALVAAVTTSPYVAAIGLATVGWGSIALNVINLSVRQRVTPPEILGRVMGIYRAGAVGAMLFGALAGGAVATAGGLRLPWLLFGLVCLATALLMRRRLTTVVGQAVAAADARVRADAREESD
jgi:MFS family permease